MTNKDTYRINAPHGQTFRIFETPPNGSLPKKRNFQFGFLLVAARRCEDNPRAACYHYKTLPFLRGVT
jgi:hypothetical protein